MRALDLGTSSVRALLVSGAGEPLPDALARRPTRMEIDDDGRAELDPDAVVAALGDCADELSERGHLRQVTDVAMSCAWHSVIGVGAGAQLADQPGRLQAATGALPHTTYWTVKVPWLAR